jgi:hypothetical protein
VTLAGVLLGVGVGATGAAHALATAGRRQGDAVGQGGLGSELAVGLGNDLFAHGISFFKKMRTRN